MPTFIISINLTDQGIKNIKESPKRMQAGKSLLKKMGGRVKQVYLTSGDNDAVMIAEAPNGDVMTKFAMALSSFGNVRTNTVRAWPEAEFKKMVSELP
jgi:uncharacterized protein with GYD domain